jgi:hypothetical protein
MEMIYRYAEISPVEIGRMFEGLDYTAVSRERGYGDGLKKNPRKAVKGIEIKLLSRGLENLEGISIEVEAYTFVRSPPRIRS